MAAGGDAGAPPVAGSAVGHHHRYVWPVAGRLGLSDLSPSVACGRYPAKAVVGEVITVSATVFREGHDAVAANVLWHPPAGAGPAARPTTGGPLILMTREADWSSRFEATVVPDRQGLWTLQVQAWGDPLGTWRHAVQVKADAGQSGDRTGQRPGDRRPPAGAGRSRAPGSATPAAIRAAIDALRDTTRSVTERIGPALSDELWSTLTADPIRELITTSDPVHGLGRPASWPSSAPGTSSFPAPAAPRWTPTAGRCGTARSPTAIAQLDRAAAMGFDVVYLPPIHPIGEAKPQGPQQLRRAASPMTSGRRGPSGRRPAATTRSIRSSAPSTTSTTSSPRPATAAWRSRSTWP